MSKPKEAPKIRVYVYEYLLASLKNNFQHLALQTDSEILNYLMIKELSQINTSQISNTAIVKDDVNDELVNLIDDDVD